LILALQAPFPFKCESNQLAVSSMLIPLISHSIERADLTKMTLYLKKRKNKKEIAYAFKVDV
jgi:hypothetical protein